QTYSLDQPETNKLKEILKLPGEHNVLNALAALAAARLLKIPDEVSVKTLNDFIGTWRRMEYKGEINGAKIYDDYGHHPTEIRATLQGAKELLGGRLWCVFQPHQYQRTYQLFDQFVSAFEEADKVILLPIYSVAGREKEEIKKKINSEKLFEAIKNRNLKSGIMNQEILYFEGFEKTVGYLKRNLSEGDICIIMGAGDIYKLTEKLIYRNQKLKSKN
ncbi:UDP-N-acetylmuramate--L-alanine ligase, partial [Patescibacteria group bacterium]|nr:UDP-N-acetylmuramate--L-alanine ligase [Patescibacteria group bacterium]